MEIKKLMNVIENGGAFMGVSADKKGTIWVKPEFCKDIEEFLDGCELSRNDQEYRDLFLGKISDEERDYLWNGWPVTNGYIGYGDFSIYDFAYSNEDEDLAVQERIYSAFVLYGKITRLL